MKLGSLFCGIIFGLCVGIPAGASEVLRKPCKLGFGLRFIRCIDASGTGTPALVCATANDMYLLDVGDGHFDAKLLHRMETPIFALEAADISGDGNDDLIVLCGRATPTTHGLSFLGGTRLMAPVTELVIGSNPWEKYGEELQGQEVVSVIRVLCGPLNGQNVIAGTHTDALVHLAAGRFLSPTQIDLACGVHTTRLTPQGTFKASVPEHMLIIRTMRGQGMVVERHVERDRWGDHWSAFFSVLATYPSPPGICDKLLVAKHELRENIALVHFSDDGITEEWSTELGFSRTTAMVVEDFDQDGLPDFAALVNTAGEAFPGLPLLGRVEVFQRLRDGRFIKAWSWFECASFLTALAVTDLDSDQNPDLVIGDASGKLHAFVNTSVNRIEFERSWQVALSRPGIRQIRSTDSISTIFDMKQSHGGSGPCLLVGTLGGILHGIVPPKLMAHLRLPRWGPGVSASFVLCLVFVLRRRRLHLWEREVAWSANLRCAAWLLLAMNLIGHGALCVTLLTMGAFTEAWEFWRKSWCWFFAICPVAAVIAPLLSLWLARSHVRVSQEPHARVLQIEEEVRACAAKLQIPTPNIVPTHSPVPFVVGTSSTKAGLALWQDYMWWRASHIPAGRTALRGWIFLELAHIRNGDIGFARWIKSFVPLGLILYLMAGFVLVVSGAGKFLPFQVSDYGVATVGWYLLLLMVSRSYLSERERATFQIARRESGATPEQVLALNSLRVLPKEPTHVRFLARIRRTLSARRHCDALRKCWMKAIKNREARSFPRVLLTFVALVTDGLIDAALCTRRIPRRMLAGKPPGFPEYLFRSVFGGVIVGFLGIYSVLVATSLYMVHGQVFGFWPFGLVHDSTARVLYQIGASAVLALMAGTCLFGLCRSVAVEPNIRHWMLTACLIVTCLAAALTHAGANVFSATLGAQLILSFPDVWCFYAFSALVLFMFFNLGVEAK